MDTVSLGQAHEAELQLREAGATAENFWGRIARSKDLARRVVAFVLEASRLLIAKIDRNMTNWTCVEPVLAEEGEFESVLSEFLRHGEPCVGGEEMVKRAKEQGALTGLRHAETMLRDQDKIPADQRKFCLVFPEVWVDSDGNRYVPYLYWHGERWCLDFDWLGYDFYSYDRLVRPRKCQK